MAGPKLYGFCLIAWRSMLCRLVVFNSYFCMPYTTSCHLVLYNDRKALIVHELQGFVMVYSLHILSDLESCMCMEDSYIQQISL